MKAAIYSRVIDETQILSLQLFFEALFQQKVEPVLYKSLYEQIHNKVRLPESVQLFTCAADLTDGIEHIISLGGDGTLLDTITLVRDKKIGVMGINFGRLGFLANIGKDEIQMAIDAIVNRKYVLDHRSLIHLDANIPLFGKTPYCLNEFAIHKKDSSPMIKIHTYLNGEFLNTYWADGLIVATPTGSTGYSLSCNGPVVFPDSKSFVITPVAPHNLNIRPIIVPDNNIVSFELEGRTDGFLCSLDSRREIVGKEIQLAVKKETFDIKQIGRAHV